MKGAKIFTVILFTHFFFFLYRGALLEKSARAGFILTPVLLLFYVCLFSSSCLQINICTLLYSIRGYTLFNIHMFVLLERGKIICKVCFFYTFYQIISLQRGNFPTSTTSFFFYLFFFASQSIGFCVHSTVLYFLIEMNLIVVCLWIFLIKGLLFLYTFFRFLRL